MFLIDEDRRIARLPEGESLVAEAITPPDDDGPWQVIIDGSVDGILTGVPLVEENLVPDRYLITETGSVSNSASVAVYLNAAGDRLVNHGQIEALNASDDVPRTGVFIEAPDSVGAQPEVILALNGGVIQAGVGISVEGRSAADARAINMGLIEATNAGMSGGGFLENRGLIRMTGDLIDSNGDGSLFVAPIGMFGTGADAVVNAGVIEAGIGMFSLGAEVMRNDGVIRQIGPQASDGFDSAVIGNGIMVNTGLIDGIYGGVSWGTEIIRAATPPGTFTNSGVVRGGDGPAFEGAGRVVNFGLLDGDVDFGEGNDRYLGTEGAVRGRILLGDGDDRAKGGAGSERILGKRGADHIEGGGGADTLKGGGGDDRLNGGAGADEITGGRGNDRMEGGTGADVFIFGLRSDDDVILDFEGQDRLDLTALAATEEAVLAAALETTAGVVLDLDAVGGDGQVLLAGVRLEDLADGFLL